MRNRTDGAREHPRGGRSAELRPKNPPRDCCCPALVVSRVCASTTLFQMSSKAIVIATSIIENTTILESHPKSPCPVKSHNRVSHKYCTEVGMVITDGANGHTNTISRTPSLVASWVRLPRTRSHHLGCLWPCGISYIEVRVQLGREKVNI